jgi:hypothetical protein
VGEGCRVAKERIKTYVPLGDVAMIDDEEGASVRVRVRGDAGWPGDCTGDGREGGDVDEEDREAMKGECG